MLENGADPSITDKVSNTAYDICIHGSLKDSLRPLEYSYKRSYIFSKILKYHFLILENMI